MKARITVKNPFTYPTYTVMIGSEIIKGFYSRAEATKFRNNLNKNNEVRKSEIVETINQKEIQWTTI